MGEAVAAALQGAERIPAGAGCLAPMARVAAALRSTQDNSPAHAHAVVTAAAEGNTAVCLVIPGGFGGAEASSR